MKNILIFTSLFFSLFIYSCTDPVIEIEPDQQDHGKYEDWINVQNYENNTKAFFVDANGHEKEFDIIINNKINSSFPNVEIRLAEINQGEFDLIIHKFDKNETLGTAAHIKFEIVYNRLPPTDSFLPFLYTNISFDENGANRLNDFYNENIDILGHTYEDVYVFKSIIFTPIDNNSAIQTNTTLYIQKEIGILAFDYKDDFYVFDRFQ